MNFIWEAIALRLFVITKTLIEPIECVNVIDYQPEALRWWQSRISQPCHGVPYQTYPQLQNLSPSRSTFIWVLPPAQYFADETWLALLQSIRAVCQHYFIFATFGVDSQSQLEKALGIEAKMHVPDLHTIGDQLVQAGWQRPMVQSQRLSINYHKSKTLWEDLVGLGTASQHPLFYLPDALPTFKNQVLKQPIDFEINIALCFNHPKKQAGISHPDGSYSIALEQMFKD